MRRKLFSVFLSLCMMLSLLSIGAMAENAAFTDMPEEDYWSYSALTSAVENGLLQGDGGKLMPGENLTRAQLAAILNRAFGAEDTTDISGYSDVGTAAWYYTDIAMAVRMDTLQGFGNSMRPEDPVTRQEAFAVLARAMKLSDGDTAALEVFSDNTEISAWAAPALAAMVQAGYVSGSDGKLCPLETITREEFAQVMTNMFSDYVSAAGTYTESFSGNVLVSAGDVTLKGLTITGDLIIGEGVASGDITLDGVTVTGRVVVRGGGENSIHIINNSDVGSIILGKTGDGGVRVRTEEGCRVDVVYIDDGLDDIILEGTFNQVSVETDAPVVLKDATVTGLTVSGGGASVKLEGATNVSVMQITQQAAGATLDVGSGAKVTKVESAAEGVTISGAGRVTQAVISGNNTAVNTTGTSVTAQEGTTGVTQNGKDVSSGSSTTTSGGGYALPTEITVTSDAQLVAAIQNSQYQKIWVGSSSSDEDQSFTIPSGQSLTMGTGRALYVTANKYGNPTMLTIASGASLTVAGTLYTDGYVQNMGTLTVTGTMEISAESVLENRGALTVAQVTNDGYVADAGTLTGTIGGNYKTYTASDGSTAPTSATLLTADVEITANATLSQDMFIPMGVALGVSGAGNTLTIDADIHLAGTLWVEEATLSVTAGSTITLTCATDGSQGQVANGTLSLTGSGALVNSGTINLIHGLLFGAETASVTNNADALIRVDGGMILLLDDTCAVSNSGSIVISPYGVQSIAPQVTGNGVEQEYLQVDTQAELRQAMADGVFTDLVGDVTLTSDLDITNELFIMNVESEPGIYEPYTLTIPSGVTVTIEEGAELVLFGEIVNNGTFINGADSNGMIMGSYATFENNGIFNNRNHLGVFEGEIQNSGVFNIGDGDNAHIFLVGGVLENLSDGTVNNDEGLYCWSSEGEIDAVDGGRAATITNAGDFNNGPTEDTQAHITMDGGALTNTGRFVNNGNMDLTDAALTHSAGAFENYNCAGLTITGGSLNTSGADEGSFNNEGYMKVVDEYGGDGEYPICHITIGAGTFDNDSDWLEYTAVVYSTGDMTAAEAEQAEKKGDLPGDGYFDVYNRMDIIGDLTVTGEKPLAAFDMYWVMARWDDSANGGEGGEVPVTLTVDVGATLTVGQGCALHVDSGVLENNGTLITAAASGEGETYQNGGTVDIWPGGEFTNSGTVTNNGEFIIRYIENDSAQQARTGNISGTEVTGVHNLAVVHTAAGLKAAIDSSSPVFNRIEIKDGSNITLTESLTINANLYIEPDSGLIVPYGESLEFTGDHWVQNCGDISVYGTMTIGSSVEFYNENSMEIGALTGSQTGTVTVSDGGLLYCTGIITVYKTGVLANNGEISISETGTIDAEDGAYTGTDPFVEVGGTFISPPAG